ncbi:MAG: hypothetical protein ACYTF8_04695 [Planctomycetota bacterium]|jgi:hypothetical protein
MGAGRRIRWILILLAAVAMAFAGDDEEKEEEKQEAPKKWEDELLTFEPLRLESGADSHQIELTIERWGEVAGPQKFTVRVVSKPVFIEEATWHPGAEIELGEKDDTKTVQLRLKLAGTGSGENDLVLAVRAEGEDISPRERRITLSLVFGRAEPEGAAYVIKHDAPEKIKPEELPDHVDWDAKPVYCCDRVAIFFTPPVNLEAKKVVFHWSVRRQPDEEEDEKGKNEKKKNKEEEEEGSFSGCWNPGDWFHHDGVALFPKGKVPARFGMEFVPIDAFGRFRHTPGNYVITSAGEQESDSSLFGEKGAVVLKPVEVAQFEVAALPDLRFASFQADSGRRLDLSRLRSVVEGVAEFAAVEGGGRKVRFKGKLDFVSAWESHPDGTKKRKTFQRVVEITFPEVLKLREQEMGKLECKFDRGQDVDGPISMALDFIGTIYELVPVAEGELDGSLFLTEKAPVIVGGISKDRNEEDGRASAPFKMLSLMAQPTLIYGKGLRPYTVSFAKWDTYGRPDRPLGAHLRDSATKFVIPVRFSFLTGTDDPQAYDQLGYAVYRAEKQ